MAASIDLRASAPSAGKSKTRERPILMSGAMVRATLADLKTHTRRIITPQPCYANKLGVAFWESGPVDYRLCPYGQPGDRLWIKETWQLALWDWEDAGQKIRYQPDGATKWQDMDENFHEDDPSEWLEKHVKRIEAIPGAQWIDPDGEVSTDPDESCTLKWDIALQPWNPSIFMPRWASRILLEITNIRVERVQDISEADCIAEGIQKVGDYYGGDIHPAKGTPKAFNTAVDAYRDLWDSLNAKRHKGRFAWKKNPWVWVIEFRRLLPSVSSVANPDSQLSTLNPQPSAPE